ncbi:probable myosin-binding protein 5 [Cynara cardunculus var. scolymus]|uniref:probable myosin-binding protein 5 n=1 Tax=Cynara cardunculus var. scolymus TaxID=59895 RepID=UPI000D62CCA2|nr:probable myosin-binding protein 5 [Cynara cardunculus var. scolymus]
MRTSKRTFRMFVEEELGGFPHFLVGAVLEWLLIASLFIDGFLAFLSNKFAMIFELDPPCVLCTRIDQSLASTNSSSYYNNSICESHKKDISSLAYCHVHRKLGDIRSMCEVCLLSFAMEKESEDDTKKPVEPKDVDASKDGERKMTLKPVKTGKENDNDKVIEMSKCSCCGDPFKTRYSSKVFVRTPSTIRALAPNMSPRAPFTPVGWRQDDGKNTDLSHVRYTELKFISDNEPYMHEDDYGLNTDSKSEEDMKSATAPLLQDHEEGNEESCKTPSGGKLNKFFGLPLADAIANSPRFAKKKIPDFVTDTTPDEPADGDSVIHHLKRQLRADKRLLMTLYQELNEERNASAVAANQSMAMITRLQAEKASIEMEALQYQRMMEEQAEYDQDAIQVLKDMLVQKEKDIKSMEAELEAYKEKYGEIKKEEMDEFRNKDDGGYQETRPRSSLLGGEKLEMESPRKQEAFDNERCQLFDMLKNLEYLVQLSDEDKEKDEEYKANLEREMSLMKEKLSAIEADRIGFLKQAATALQKGDERAELLTEIAQHLKKLRA